MGIFKFGHDNQEIARLKNLVDQETHALQKMQASIEKIEGLLKSNHETRKLIRDKRRATTGSVPLSLFYDICKALQLDPDERFPSSLKESEVRINSNKADILSLRAEVMPKAAHIQKRIHRLEEMLRCAGSRPGNLDYELYCVLKKYSGLDIDVTIDESVGIALANVYHRTGSFAEVRRLATHGQFALREVGNCAADVVFDPRLRELMAKRHRQLGEWGRHTVMREYLRITENSTGYDTVKAYVVRSDQLKDLPEHVLYGLIICGKNHAMRILEVEEDGLHVVEGNWNGDLNFGRYVSFSEIAWGGNDLIVFSRQPSSRHGFVREFAPYDYTNPDAVGYESLQEILDDEKPFAYFKLKSEVEYERLPLHVRDSLSILRFRPGKSYDMTYYSDLIDSAQELFPGNTISEIVSVFLQTACCNPTGLIVVSTITSGRAKYQLLSRFTREVPPEAAKQMYVFFDKEGGDEVSLCQLRQITEPVRRERGDMVPRIFLMTLEEFLSLDEDAKRAAAILTPRRDYKGYHIEAKSYFEEQLMRVCANDPSMLMDDEHNLLVSQNELMQNPLEALIIIERPFDMLGICSRLTTDELSILDKYPFITTAEGMQRLISRKFEIRQQYTK
jgi:hypothetical protein